METAHATHHVSPYWRLLAFTFAVIAGAAHAAIYKWVDENGVTQYSEKPPSGKKTEQLPIQTKPAAPPAQASQGASGLNAWQEKEADFQRRRAEQEIQRKKQDALDQATAAERSRNCIGARETLHALDQQRRIYRLNEKGERVYIDDQEREQTREQMRQIIEQNCARK